MTNTHTVLKRQRYRLVAQVERLLDAPATYLAFVFAAALVVELVMTAQGHAPPVVLDWLQLGIWAFFLLHFALGMIIAPARLSYLRHHWLTALSLLVPFLRVIRIVRVVRILRAASIVRLFGAMNRTTASLRRALAWNALGMATGLAVSTAFLSSAGIYLFEADAPRSPIHSYAEALWWAAATLTTVGAASEPVTLGGRVLALVVMLAGLVLFGYVAGLLGALLFTRREASAQSKGTHRAHRPDRAGD